VIEIKVKRKLLQPDAEALSAEADEFSEKLYQITPKKSRALNETPSQSYGVSLTICDHTVLPTCHPTQVNTPHLNTSWRPVLDLSAPREGRLS